MSELRHVSNLWRDSDAPADPVNQLVYRSNLLGSDLCVTNTGGGNTSVKVCERDLVSGSNIDVLWVKGSGGDLRTATVGSFAALRLAALADVRAAYEAGDARGLKSPAEDAVVARYRDCAFGDAAVAPSIDTPLHAFVPAAHVDHTHPNAIVALAATRRSRELTAEVFGDEVGWVPWMRPGIELALQVERHTRVQPHHVGLVLGQHGLINWADDGKACYERTLSLIERASRFIEAHDKGSNTFGGPVCEPLEDDSREVLLAALLPWLRPRMSGSRPMIATVEWGDAMQRFVNSRDARRLAALGTSCPDHFLRTKIKPLLADWHAQRDDRGALFAALERQLEEYQSDYRRYYDAYRRPDSPPMRDARPAIVLVPGVGMIAWGRNKSESRIAAECYNCAVEVMRGAEAIDEYVPLPSAEAFDVEYWSLEEAKLRRLPAEGAMAGRVAVVVDGMGTAESGSHCEALCAAVMERGGHAAFVGADPDRVAAAARRLVDRFGAGVGVAGSGASACGRAVGIVSGFLNSASRRGVYSNVRQAFGGADYLLIVRQPERRAAPLLSQLANEWSAVGGTCLTELAPEPSCESAAMMLTLPGPMRYGSAHNTLSAAVVAVIDEAERARPKSAD